VAAVAGGPARSRTQHPTAQQPNRPANSSFLSGEGESGSITGPGPDLNVVTYWSNLTRAERNLLASLRGRLQADVTLDALARYEQSFRSFVRDSDRMHLADCRDPECEVQSCRIRRGWTRGEIDADEAAWLAAWPGCRARARQGNPSRREYRERLRQEIRAVWAARRPEWDRIERAARRRCVLYAAEGRRRVRKQANENEPTKKTRLQVEVNRNPPLRP